MVWRDLKKKTKQHKFTRLTLNIKTKRQTICTYIPPVGVAVVRAASVTSFHLPCLRSSINMEDEVDVDIEGDAFEVTAEWECFAFPQSFTHRVSRGLIVAVTHFFLGGEMCLPLFTPPALRANLAASCRGGCAVCVCVCLRARVCLSSCLCVRFRPLIVFTFVLQWRRRWRSGPGTVRTVCVEEQRRGAGRALWS